MVSELGQPDNPDENASEVARRSSGGPERRSHHDADSQDSAHQLGETEQGGSITHYHGEFRGQPVDLYTDGTRWVPGDRVPGENVVVGQPPDTSPGDTSDLPPTGEQLLEMEGDKVSRFESLRQETEKQENLDGLHSEVEHDARTIQKWLQDRPPAGRADQPVPASPQLSPEMHHYEVDAGSVAAMGLVLGVISVEAVRWAHHKLDSLRGR